MKKENAIEVKCVSKKFRVFLDKGKTLKEVMLFSKRRKYEERIVLDNINFDVRKGEAIGLIGQNGCGKSTTLKLLTKIMYPDSGDIEMRGRVSSLIELGAGFHPDMSGRQNIYTNASIFGLTRREIDARINDIIAFSELEQFIDNPVRTYSSGMYMRLAFSVAINVDADILLIDEILAVGDANFQAKCFNKLREIKASGTTIVIVSHSLGQIEQICERSIWIQDGQIKAEGRPYDIHPMYMDFMGEKRQEIIEKEQKREADKGEEHKAEKGSNDRWGNGKVRLKTITLSDVAGNIKSAFKTGEKVVINITYSVKEEFENVIIGIAVFRNDGTHCYGTNTKIDNINDIVLNKDGALQLVFEHVELLPGEYYLDFAVESLNGETADYYAKAKKIELFSNKSDIGICRLRHTWSI